MRKILLVLVSILLLAGVAQASEWTSGLNAELSAQSTGRTIATDSSVVLQVYYVGTGAHPSVGISADTITLYDDGAADTTVNTAAAATDTLEEIVNSINSDGDWAAVVGPDGYNAYSLAHGSGAGGIIVFNNTYTIGSNIATAVDICADSSILKEVTCGVKADATSRIRLKNVNQNWASRFATIKIAVYDGDTKIWQKNIVSGSYVSVTHPSNSSSTVIPAGEKGLASTKGNSLCVVVGTDSELVDVDPSAKAFNLSIAYDKLRD